jgi:SAM-dependent methyltransferase
MAVLDCGCGVGSISLGLARAVDPGRLVGIDISESQIRMARATVEAAGLGNCEFLAADIGALPFESGTFDVVHLNCVLCHLRDPGEALRSVLRVLKSGGTISTRDPIFSHTICAPQHSLVKRGLMLIGRSICASGGDGDRGLDSPALLQHAGFIDLHIYATLDGPQSPGDRPGVCALAAANFGDTPLALNAIAQDWMSRMELDDIREAFDALSIDPAGFFATPHVTVVGTKL